MRLSPDLLAPQGAVPHQAHQAHQGLRLGAHRATPATIAAGAAGAIAPAFDLSALLMPIDGIDSLEAATAAAEDPRIFDVQLPAHSATASAELTQPPAVARQKLSLPLIFGRDAYPVDPSDSSSDEVAGHPATPIVLATPLAALQIGEKATAARADAATLATEAIDGELVTSPKPPATPAPDIVVETADAIDTAVLTTKPAIEAWPTAPTNQLTSKGHAFENTLAREGATPDIAAPAVASEDRSAKELAHLDLMAAARPADASPKPAVLATGPATAAAAASAAPRAEKHQSNLDTIKAPGDPRPVHEIEAVASPVAPPATPVHHAPTELGASHQTPHPVVRQDAAPPAADAGAPARSAFSEPSSVSALPSRLIDTMRMQMRAGGGQAEIRLAPEFLGSVRLSVVVDHGVVKATLSADSPGALDSLPWDVDRLRASLESHGLHLDEFELRDDPYGSSSQDGGAEHQRDDERPRRQPHVVTPARGLGFGEVFDVIA